MTALDRLLQRWRFAKARPYIDAGDRVLDIGCLQGDLFRHFETTIAEGVGIDPLLPEPAEGPKWKLIPGWFPDDLPDADPFDAIVMLALLEHIPPAEQPRLVRDCAQRLKPGGHLVITVPSPLVDRILAVLVRLRLIDGMSLEQHYGFRPAQTPSLLSGTELELVKAQRFQLGLNNLFVFHKRAGAEGSAAPSPG